MLTEFHHLYIVCTRSETRTIYNDCKILSCCLDPDYKPVHFLLLLKSSFF